MQCLLMLVLTLVSVYSNAFCDEMTTALNISSKVSLQSQMDKDAISKQDVLKENFQDRFETQKYIGQGWSLYFRSKEFDSYSLLHQDLNHTNEEQIQVYFNKKLSNVNIDTTIGIESHEVSQKLERFNHTDDGSFAHHHLILLHNNWRKELFSNLRFDLKIGLGLCQQLDQDEFEYMPVGQVGISMIRKKSNLTLYTGQVLSGNGFESGVYGIEKRQEVGLKGKVDLTKNLSLNLDCSLAKTFGLFNRQLNAKALSMMFSNMSLSLKLSKHLQGQINLSYHKTFAKNQKWMSFQKEDATIGAQISYSVL